MPIMDKWDLVKHWDLVLPPSRPTAQHLSLIRRHIQGIDRNSPVAVLGSTPEFVDLLVECDFKNIYVMEKSLNFYRAVNHLRIYRENVNYVVEGDWLVTLPQRKNGFALILSDLTSGNIPYDDRGLFYNLITDALSIGGIFIDKILTHWNQNLRVSDLSQKYSLLPLNLLYINFFSCEMLFCSELLNIKNIVDTTLFYSILSEKIKNERVILFVEKAKLITPPECIWFYGRKWDELKETYCPKLDIVAVEEDEQTSPYYGRLKYFIHRKKG